MSPVDLHRHDIIAVSLGDDRRRLGNPLAEDVALDNVRQPDKQFMRNVVLRRHGEDLVQFFQGELLGLTHEAEDHEPGNQIQTSIEAECTSRSHDRPHSREGQAEDTSKGVVDADSPRHALLTLDGREDLGRVLEGNWTLTERVHDGEEIDEQYNRADLFSAAAALVQQRKTTTQQEEAHEWEGGQSQRPTALGINEEQGRDRGHDLDSTVSQRGVKGLINSVTDILEDGGAVEGDNCVNY